MPIPDYESIMLPLLQIAAAANGEVVKLSDATHQLAQHFNLSEKERTELLPSGSTFKFASRASWARTYLQKAELLDRVKKCSPQFFEHLVIQLLLKMGYGGSLKDAGEALGKTGDGEVDGVIREDKLGLDNIYIQAKHWTDKPVGSPDLDQFSGALSKKKAAKGIFITTSTFTKDAKNSLKDYSSRIVLIDGSQLVKYMIDYSVGVSVMNVFELKK